MLNKLEIVTSNNQFARIADKPYFRNNELENLIKIFNNNTTKIHRHDKWEMIKIFEKKFPDNKDEISNKLNVFKNVDGEFKPLARLISSVEEYQPHYIFNFLKIEEAENNDILNYYFLSKNKIWYEIIENWESIIPLLQKDETNFSDSESLYKTLSDIFKLSKSNENIKSDIEMFYTTDGHFVKREDIFITNYLSGYNHEEYTALESFINKTNLYLPPFELLKFFNNEPFYSKESSLSDIMNNLHGNIDIILEELKILNKLVKDCDLQFFNHFIIHQKSGDNITISERSNEEKQYFSVDEKLNKFLADEGSYILLPEELYQTFKNDESLKIANSESFVENIIDEYGADESFIDIVAKQSERVANIYINEISEINLSSAEEYNNNSFEVKMLQLCKKHNLIENIKEKIFINKNEILDYEYDDEFKIEVNSKNIPFFLSEIHLQYIDVSAVRSKIKRNLRKFVIVDEIFSHNTMSNSEVYNKIEKKNITLNQLTFAVAYHLSENKEWELQKSFSQFNNIDILNIFYKKKLDYTKYFQIEDFNPKSQINTEETNFILDTEGVPKWVKAWITESDEEKNKKIKYLNNKLNLNKEDHPAIKIREQLLNNNFIKLQNISNLIEDTFFTNNTLKWAKNNLNNFIIDSNNFNAIQEIIRDNLVENNSPKYALSFKKIQEDNITLKISEIEDKSYFITDSEYLEKLMNANNPNYKDILCFRKSDEKVLEVLKESGKTQLEITKKFCLNENGQNNEWSEDYYQKWLNDEKVSYKGIFFTQNEIPFTYSLNENGRIIQNLGNFYDGDIAIHKESKKIYISDNYRKDRDIIEILEENVETLFPNSDDKDQLRMLYKYKNLELKDIIKPDETSDIVKIAKGISSDNKEFLTSNTKDIIDLIDKLEWDKLKKLLESKVDIDELLKNQKERKSEIEPIYGYIGEALFNYYLEETKKENDFEWSSQREPNPTPEYDFEFKKLRVEVKTNIGSLLEKNGSMPFYIKLSQLDYIKNHNNVKYNIARISLEDIGLSDWAREIKKKYGQPNINNGNLSKEVKEIINKKAKEHILTNEEFYEKLIVFTLKADNELNNSV